MRSKLITEQTVPRSVEYRAKDSSQLVMQLNALGVHDLGSTIRVEVEFRYSDGCGRSRKKVGGKKMPRKGSFSCLVPRNSVKGNWGVEGPDMDRRELSAYVVAC